MNSSVADKQIADQIEGRTDFRAYFDDTRPDSEDLAGDDGWPFALYKQDDEHFMYAPFCDYTITAQQYRAILATVNANEFRTFNTDPLLIITRLSMGEYMTQLSGGRIQTEAEWLAEQTKRVEEANAAADSLRPLGGLTA